MKISDLIQAAMHLAIQSEPELHQRWVEITLKMSGKYALASATRASSDTRIDLLLRQLEREAIGRLSDPEATSGLWTFDFQLSLSECWVLSSYEIIRVAYQQARKLGEKPEKLLRLRDRFGLVRMPLAKYEIASANRKKPELMLEAVTGNPDPKPYRDDGSYIIPRGWDEQTGSVMWWPIDLATETSIPVSRRMLSDEFLAVFD